MLKARDVRASLDQLVGEEILPIARRYQYEPISLSQQTAWKPIVLIIGNYSSGKSSLINELIGAPVQRTGQAPTDDCFTVLVGPEGDEAGPPAIMEEEPGQTVVNDPGMPFTGFKKFGSRFISHFQLKRVRSPILQNLAIIDSPGMLDSVTELDRGYDYQEVIGRLAELADLVVLVFDPHRAGTIKETYVSIRSTLPEATSEDRVLFVMNRVDECKNLTDLLRCYGVLCWNLSQMTGRKDIPRIFLTFSPTLAQPDNPFGELADERVELVRKIEQAPRQQVSHLLGAVDNHLHKLEMIARTLAGATSRLRQSIFTYIQASVAAVVVGTVLLDSVLAYFAGGFNQGSIGRLFSGNFLSVALAVPVVLLLLGAVASVQYYKRVWKPALMERLLGRLSEFASLDTRYSRDLWDGVKGRVEELFKDPRNSAAFAPHRQNAVRLRRLMTERMKELYEQHLGSAPPIRNEVDGDRSANLS